jgi:hypothetical protein
VNINGKWVCAFGELHHGLVGTTMENLLGHGKKQTPKEFSLVKG